MALVIAADNQRKVATSFEEAGAALSLSDSERAIRPERFQELLELLRTPERLECMRKAGLQMVDGLGAGRVAEVMVSHPLRLRSAKEDDAKLIFDWANEPVTRQMSFSTNEISWKSHLRWFKNQITSSDCRSLIAVNSDGEPVGQVRLTREDYSAVLSISIDPKERGKGYAPKIARLAAAEALTENWCTEVRALVKSENVASVKTFLKAGFRQRGFRLDESKSTVIFTMSTIDFLSQS
jgi:RimJ/RimL family protein N-acetyltransferase